MFHQFCITHHKRIIVVIVTANTNHCFMVNFSLIGLNCLILTLLILNVMNNSTQIKIKLMIATGNATANHFNLD